MFKVSNNNVIINISQYIFLNENKYENEMKTISENCEILNTSVMPCCVKLLIFIGVLYLTNAQDLQER